MKNEMRGNGEIVLDKDNNKKENIITFKDRKPLVEVPSLQIITFENSTVDGIDSRLKESIAKTYKNVFESPPWDEDWPLNKSREVIEKYIEYIKIKGGILEALFIKDMDTWKTTGFSIVLFNYELPELVKDNDSPMIIDEKVMFGAEFGIIPNCQGQGYGLILMSSRKRALRKIVKDTVKRLMKQVTPIGKMIEDEYDDRIYYEVEF